MIRSIQRITKVYPLILLLLVGISCTNPCNKVCEDMIEIPSGVFMMGSDAPNADLDEYPVHKVEVPSFRLCKFEVDQTLWKSVMGRNPSSHKGDNLPVEMVSHNDVEHFIYKLNKKTGKKYRLPTEIEWEYAAFLGTTANNKLLDDIAWFQSNSNGESHPIGTKCPDALGLYDMIGNVNEWVADFYDGNNYSGILVNPTDSSERESIFRGGAFNCEPRYCRICNRNHVRSDMRNYAIGFRLAE